MDARNRALHDANARASALELDANPASRESAEDLRRELRIAVTERDEAQTGLRQSETRSERLRAELEVLHGIHERMLDDIERTDRKSDEVSRQRLGSGVGQPLQTIRQLFPTNDAESARTAGA